MWAEEWHAPCTDTLMRLALPGLAFVAAIAGREVVHRRGARTELRGQVALITGSSRGLGLALARELAQRGCRVVLCARNVDELDRARESVSRLGADVLAIPCDVSDNEEVRHLVAQVTDQLGGVDILINNAGIITVGPLETHTLDDFERAMATMFWGTLYPTLAVLPRMRARCAGRIANITSIGGRISVPHLLPYGSAKFATVGLSEGLHAELAQDGISVTTVVPGLMRTGSHLNASFKGEHKREFFLFSLLDLLPFTSVSATDAARQIVDALARGDAELVIGWQARLLSRVHGLLPGLTSDVLGLVNRALPGPEGIGSQRKLGSASRSPAADKLLPVLGEREPAQELNQLG